MYHSTPSRPCPVSRLLNHLPNQEVDQEGHVTGLGRDAARDSSRSPTRYSSQSPGRSGSGGGSGASGGGAFRRSEQPLSAHAAPRVQSRNASFRVTERGILHEPVPHRRHGSVKDTLPRVLRGDPLRRSSPFQRTPRHGYFFFLITLRPRVA